MDFNLILLLAGLGLLAVVALCALLGYFCGLKRELICIAVFIVLLVLTWLVFGDAATLLNAKFGQNVADILGINDSSIVTIWDAIVAYAKTVIPNGEVLLVEGNETYSLCLSIASAVCRAAGLLVGTLAILIICPIIRLITFIVRLIVKKVKANKAKAKEEQTLEAQEQPADEKADMVVADEASTEEEKGEQVVVNEATTGQDAVVTKDENELEQKPTRRPILGAVAGALKGLFVMVLVCVPFAGISSIAEKVSDDTKGILSEALNGTIKVELAESNDTVDMVFDLVDSYDNSILGKYDGISAFFFKESFGERLFDQMFKIETDNQKMYLSEEIEVFITAANELEGNTNFTTMSKEQFANVLNALKDSKLLVEAMPAVIEFLAAMDSVEELLGTENMAFLELRYINWDKDLETILDAVIEAYDLGLFPIKDLNFLTLDVEELREVTTILGNAELMNEAYPLLVKVAFGMPKVQELFGDITGEIQVEELDIATELDALVDIYAKFQKLEITSLDNLDTNALISEILNDEETKEVAVELIKDLLDLQVAQTVAVPALFGFLENNEKISSKLETADVLDDVLALKDSFTLDEVKIYVDTVVKALDLVDTTNYPEIKFDAFNLDETILNDVIDSLFSAESSNEVITIAATVLLELDPVKNFLGEVEGVSFDGVDWQSELKLFVDIYGEFKNLGFQSAEDLKGDTIELVKDIVNNEAKMATVENILNKLVDAQTFSKVVAPIAQHLLNKVLGEKGFEEFKDIIDVTELTNDEWKEDFSTILDIAEDVNDLGILDNLNPFDFGKLDITSEAGSQTLKDIISKIFTLNILGDDTTKTELLMATIEKFEWTELSEDFDPSTIVWEDEKQVILNLIDVLVKIDALEDFDIHNLAQTDWVALLNDEENIFADYLVEALEELIESNIFLEVLPGVIDKYLLPKLNLGDDFDDSELIRDIINKFDDGSQGSEELVKEIIKLVEVVKAIVELNILDAKEQGIEVIDITNTDAFRTIINGIFDSKLVEGLEGRIVRIILKLANILNIEKGSDLYNELVSVDFDGEQEVLIGFIDAIEPVLKDEDFSIFDEEGKVIVVIDFWTTNENAQALLNAVDVLVGAYEDENANGSKLVAVLLPSLYDKYLEGKDFIPTPYDEIIEILDVTNATGKDLMHDVSCITYIIDKLVELDALNLVQDGDFSITDEASQAILCEIIDVLYDITLFKGNETKFVEWCVNFVFDKLNLEMDLNDELDTITSEDWATQKEQFKAVLVDILNFLNAQCGVETYKEILAYVEKNVLVENLKQLINEEAIDQLTDILNDIIDIKVFEVVVPEVAKELILKLKDKGYDLTYIFDVVSLEGKPYEEFIIDDLHALLDIIDFAVVDLKACEIYDSKASGDIALPTVEQLHTLIDDMFDLTIVNASHGIIATLVYENVVPKLLNGKTEIITIDKFEFENVDWAKEKEVIKDLVTIAYDFLEAVNCPANFKDVKEFIDKQEYTDINMIREEVAAVATDALRVLANSNILENIIDDLYNYGVFQIADNEKLPFTIEYLRDVPSNLLIQDIRTLADILDQAVEFGILEYIKNQNITNINVEKIAVVVESLYDLNIIKVNEQELFYDLYNYVAKQLGNIVKYDFLFTKEEIATIDFQQEFVNLANIVRELDSLLEARFIKDLNGLLDLVKNKTYTQKAFYKDEATVKALVDILDVTTNLQLVELITPQLIDFVIETAENKGFDVKFLQNNVYPDLLFEDIITLLNIVAENLNESKLLDLIFDKNMEPLVNEGLLNIIDCLPELHLMKLYSDDVFASVTKVLYKKLGINKVVLPSTYTSIDINEEFDKIKEILLNAQTILDIKDINGLDLIKYYVNGKFYVDVEVLDDCYEEIQTLLNSVLDLQYINLTVTDIFDHYIGKVNVNGAGDLAGQYTSEQLISDLRLIVGLIDELVEADVLAIVFGTDINSLEVKFDVYKAILENLKELQIANSNYSQVAAVVANVVVGLLGSEIRYTADDYANAVFADDMTNIINVLTEVETLSHQLTGEFKTTFGELIAKFEKLDINADIIETILNAADEVIEIELVQGMLGGILNGIANKNVKINFLADDTDSVSLTNDVKKILQAARILLNAQVFDYVFGKDIKDLPFDFDAYREVVRLLGEVSVIDNNWDDIANLGIDALLVKLGSDIQVDYIKKEVKARYTAAIAYQDDINAIIATINELEQFAYELKANTINEILNNIKNLKNIGANYRQLAEELLDLIEAVLTIEVLRPTYEGLAQVISNKVTDIAFLFENLDSYELAEDLETICEIGHNVLDYGIIEFIYENGTIDVTPTGAAIINGVIDSLFNLNVVAEHEEKFINLVLKAIKVAGLELDELDWDQEIVEIQEVVSALYVVLDKNGLDSIPNIKEFVKFKSDNTIEDVLTNNKYELVTLLEEIVDSKVIVASLPVVGKLVLNKVANGEFAYLMDNVTAAELAEDIQTIANILVPLVDSKLLSLAFGQNPLALDLDFENYTTILEGVKALNIVGNNWDKLGVFVVNTVNKSLGINEEVTEEEFAHVVYEEDLQDLIEAVEIFEAVCKHLDVTRLQDLPAVLKNFKDIEVSNTDLVDQFLEVVRLVNSVETLHFLYPGLANKVTPVVANTGLDIEFLFEGQSGDALASDIDTVIDSLDDILVNYGLFGFLFMNQEISYEDTSLVTNAITNIANLNVLSGDNGTKLLEVLLNKFGLIENAELDLITDRDSEAQNITNIVNNLIAFLNEKGLISISAINEMHFSNAYADQAFFDEYTGELISNFLTSVAESQIVRALLPAIVNKFVGKLNIDYLDFLTELSAQELADDILDLASAVSPLIDSGLLPVIFGGKLTDLEFNFDAYEALITSIENMNIINKGYQYLVPAVLQLVLNKVDSEYDVVVEEFENISFAEDMQNVKVLLAELEEVCNILNATTVNDVIVAIKNFKDVTVSNSDTASNLVDVLEAVMNIETIQIALPAVANIVTSVVSNKGTDLTFLVADETADTLNADVNSIIAMLNGLIDYNLVDYLFMGEKLDFANPEPLTNIIVTIFGLNIIDGNESEVLDIVLNKLGISLTTLELANFDWDLESESLQALILELTKLPVLLNADYIDDLYALDINSLLYVTQTTNSLLQVIANVFEILGEDQLVGTLALPLSNKFFANPGKFAGLLDLHNIYSDNEQVSEDLLAISCAINDLIELDMFGFLNGYIDFPFDRNDIINDIIRDILTLNYLNNGTGRVNTIIQAVGTVMNKDFTDIDATNVNLVADAELLCAMYDEFSTILTDPEWLVNDISEVNPFEISKQLLTNYVLIENFFDGLSNLVNTTIYTELSGLFKLALPLVEKVAPDFYNALQLGDVDNEEMHHEAIILANIINEIEKLEINNMHSTTKYFDIVLRDCIIAILNNLDDSTLLSDHINDLVEVVVEKFVYDKNLGPVNIPYGSLDIQAIDFKQDKETLIIVINELFDFMLYETWQDNLSMEEFVYGLDDLNDYIYSMRNNLYAYFEEEYRYVFYETMVNLIGNTSLLQTNGLAIMNEVVAPVIKTDVDGLLDFTQFTNNEFAADLTAIGEILTQIRELGLYPIMRDEMIDYDQADEVNALLANIAELNYLDHNLDAVIDFVDNKGKLPIKLEALKDDRFDHEYDIKLLGTIYETILPILLEDGYVFISISVYEDFIANKHTIITTIEELAKEYKYTLVEAYEELVTMTALPLLFDELMNFANTKVPEKYRPIIEAMDVESLEYDEIKADLAISAEMIRTLVDIDLENIIKDRDLFWYAENQSTLNNTVIDCQNIDLVLLLIDQVYSLNMVANRADVTLAILEVLGVDTTNIDLSNYVEEDWKDDLEGLKTVIVEFAAAVEPFGITSTGELHHYFTQVLGKLNKDKVVKEMQAMYDMLDFKHLANVFTALGDANVLDGIFSATFMGIAYPKVPADLKDVLDLTEYTGENLTADMYYLADFCNAIATVKERNAELGGEVKDNYDDEVMIDAVATMIESILSLDLLTLKKVEIVEFVDTKVKADLSGLDASSMNLKEDALILASSAKDIFYAFCATEYFRELKDYEYLGNTDLMTSVVAVYETLITTTIGKEVSYWASDEYADKLVGYIPEIKEYTNDQIDELLANLGITLNGMLEMGVFSNDEIDFTNVDATNNFFTVFNFVYANNEKVMKNLTKIQENVALIGTVAINYAGIVKEEETPAIKDMIKVVKDFLDEYKASLSNNFAVLADANCQDDILNGTKTALTSKIANQLFLPIANGLVKIYTVEKQQLNILDGVDTDKFINQFLPDMFNIVDALAPLGALEKRFEYNDADLLIDLLYAIIFNDSTRNHLGDLTRFAAAYAEVEIAEDADLDSINWEKEYEVLANTLTALKAELATLNVKEPITYQNNDFLTALAVACSYLETSELLPYILRSSVERLVTTGFGFEYDAYINRLYDATYTDELMMADFAKVDEIIAYVVASNMYNGGLDSTNLDSYIKLAEIVLNLNIANGLEEDMISKIMSITPVISEYTVDYNLVSDWSVEKVAFINVLETAANLYKVVDLSVLTSADLHKDDVQANFLALVKAMSESVIGQELLPQIYTDKVQPVLHPEYQDFMDFSDPTLTPDKWVDKFAELFEANDTAAGL